MVTGQATNQLGLRPPPGPASRVRGAPVPHESPGDPSRCFRSHVGSPAGAPPRAEPSPWRPPGPWKPELVSGCGVCAKLPGAQGCTGPAGHLRSLPTKQGANTLPPGRQAWGQDGEVSAPLTPTSGQGGLRRSAHRTCPAARPGSASGSRSQAHSSS